MKKNRQQNNPLIGKEISVAVTRLAGLGEGEASLDGQKLFIPCTLEGDTVRAVITRAAAGILRGRLVEVLAPSAQRVAAPCAHYNACGGCALQHVEVSRYAAFKRDMLVHAVRKAGGDVNVVEPLVTAPAQSRRRAEFRISKDAQGNPQLGFFARESHRPVAIDICHVLHPDLQKLLPQLRAALATHFAGQDLPESVALLLVDGKFDACFFLDAKPASAASYVALGNGCAFARVTLKYHDAYHVVHEAEPVAKRIADAQVNLPPDIFMQASDEGERALVAEVTRAVQGAKKAADLFSGIGTFSFPLAAHGVQVQAFEIEARMVDALNAAAQKSGANVKAAARNLFATPLRADELAGFDLVVINPPREGAREQCEQLAASDVARVVMVSCNPATFARDAKILLDGGYTLKRAVPVDQFVWSGHLESVVVFER